MNPLGERLARAIRATGPLTVADYMAAALTDPEYGYYRRADPLGAGGDFTTAPEISQVFGELIGLWLADCWQQMGSPTPVRLIELGPGRGTLMRDALRAGRNVSGWRDAVDLHLIEINPALRSVQQERLGAHRPSWHDSLDDVPAGPMLLVANEFFDALPIRQLVFAEGAWRERFVDWNETDGFHFTVASAPSPLTLLLVEGGPDPAEHSVLEISPASIGVADQIARRVTQSGGAALIVDYGRGATETGQSLQAVSRHSFAQVLENPGEADLSAHVDFGMLAQAAREAGAACFGPTGQGDFLKTLGIVERATQLQRAASQDQSAALEAAIARLTEPSAMGTLFKVLAIADGKIRPAGFS